MENTQALPELKIPEKEGERSEKERENLKQ
jgi:hypothetical protein